MHKIEYSQEELNFTPRPTVKFYPQTVPQFATWRAAQILLIFKIIFYKSWEITRVHCGAPEGMPTLAQPFIMLLFLPIVYFTAMFQIL